MGCTDRHIDGPVVYPAKQTSRHLLSQMTACREIDDFVAIPDSALALLDMGIIDVIKTINTHAS